MARYEQTWPRWTVACPEYVVPATYESEVEALGLAAVLDSEPVACPYEHHVVQVNSHVELRAMIQRRKDDNELKEQG